MNSFTPAISELLKPELEKTTRNARRFLNDLVITASYDASIQGSTEAQVVSSSPVCDANDAIIDH